MTEKDQAVLRQVLIDVIATHTAEIDGKFNVIQSELIHIKEQTTKTNGRVTKHDEMIGDLQKADIQHLVNCPMESRMKQLEISEFSKRGMWKMILIIAGSITGLTTIVSTILQIILK
mgnify:FL=1